MTAPEVCFVNTVNITDHSLQEVEVIASSGVSGIKHVIYILKLA